MVTYLACFIVCDFEERIGETANNKIPFRVISRPDQINSTEYPLDVGIKVTDYYEDYFGLRYALPKQGKQFLMEFKSDVFI
jgi:glutamyl aminopeptidase